MIKYNNNTINKLATDATVNKMYYGGNVVYLGFKEEEPILEHTVIDYIQVSSDNTNAALVLDYIPTATSCYEIDMQTIKGGSGTPQFIGQKTDGTEYVSYQLVKATSDSKEEVVSEGTVIFSFPKYFRYVDPQLSVSVDGSRIKVKASSYAKSVEILNENEDLILSDNYFDLNADEKIVEVISGDISNLRVRSVYDIH